MKTKKVSLQELKNIIIGIAKQELEKENSTNKNSSKLSEMAKSLAEATRVTPFSFDDEFNKDEDIFDNRDKLMRVITKHLKKKPFTNNADWGGGYVWNIIGNDNYTGTFLYLGDNELTVLKRTEVGEEYQDKQIKSISNSKELYKFLKDKKI